MIRINQIKIAVTDDFDTVLQKKIKDILHINSYKSYRLIKKSIDARKKPLIYYVCSVDVDVNDEKNVLKKCRNKDVTISNVVKYKWPTRIGRTGSNQRPVIVGLGPAGLFCAYMLAEAGMKPVCIERGKRVEERTADVEQFWTIGILNTQSNVQFGEGGAGTFSDGKLNTLVNDKCGRNRKVLEIFVENGAPENILYDGKPHIGTDILSKVVVNMRDRILKNGGEIFYNTQLTDIRTDGESNPSLTGIVINDSDIIDTDKVVLAIGHSARDTFEMLHNKGICMSPKAFAVGVRVQHKASLIDYSQYGTDNSDDMLPRASYKLTYQSDSGRGVYSFCMCPGGYVVNASSEEGMLAINGMSYSDRGSGMSNSAIVCTVTPDDFTDKSPLGGLRFQRELERKAYEIGNGCIPTILYGDYKNRSIDELSDDKAFVEKDGCFKGDISYPAPVYEIFTDSINDAFIEGMEYFGGRIAGFDDDRCIVSGVESRTSSPVRIERDERHISVSLGGLYPCGEGAGYAGGITSAAMDGILIAEEIWKDE